MPLTVTERPEASEYFEYYDRYVSKVPQGDVIALLETQIADTTRLLSGLTDAQALHRYAPDKWSVKEVLGHLGDVERVMSYRALRIGRGDRTPLPGFDQDPYVAIAKHDARPLADLLEDLAHVRRATLSLFRGFDAEAMRRASEANGRLVSVRALAYIIAGHEQHHVEVLRARYGIGR